MMALNFKTKKKKADVMKWTNLDQKALNRTITRRQMYRGFLDEAYRFKDEKYMCHNFGYNVAKFLTGRNAVSTDILTVVNTMAASQKQYNNKRTAAEEENN